MNITGKNDDTLDKILSVTIKLFNSLVIDGDIHFSD